MDKPTLEFGDLLESLPPELREDEPGQHIARAYTVAEEAHAGQMRKGGELAYIQHPLAVAILLADVVMPSLDAVTPSVFQTINRPHPSLDITQVIQGLADFRREYEGQIWLEILLCRGV